MAQEIADLGFEYMELSHGIRMSLVPGILQAVEQGVVKVSSVHNFCPLPPGVMGAAPNLYEPTGSSRQEQSQWLRHTLKTIDFAHQVGADLMVIHSGSVRFWFNDPEDAYDRYREGRGLEHLAQDPNYPKILRKTLDKVRRKEGRFLQRLIDNYRRILPAAKAKGVRLGIENREGLTELPMDLEMVGLLQELGKPEICGYWHDAGHAQLKDMMGVIPHRELLNENSARQFGFHLHDVSPEGKDHQTIGSGVIDWQMLKDFIRDEHIVVLELSPRLQRDQVTASKGFIEQLLNLK
ncbi:MAG: TIM barrel protein [Opitutales bacterium]|nr:TIM barrel protein [Opitutales bacterium]